MVVKACALIVVITAAVLLTVPAGFRPELQSVEAALLSEVKKLTASDAEGSDEFVSSVAVSGDTAVVGALAEDAGGSAATREPPTSSSATRAARTTGAK